MPKITLRHGCFPVNLLHNFRVSFPKNTPGGLLLKFILPNVIGLFKYLDDSLFFLFCTITLSPALTL